MQRNVSYNDGQTARRRNAFAETDGDDLVISDAAGNELARWALADIRYVDRAHRRPPLRLMNITDDARLTLPSDDDGAWLTASCPHLGRQDGGSVKWPTWVAAGIFAVASIVGIFIYLLPAASSAIVGLVPPTLEKRIGAEARGQLLGILGRIERGDEKLVCTDPRGVGILNKRARELATLMDSPFEIHVTVVRVPVANALALPGGEVVIFSGLLDKAESGDAVIGVLAHEIAHVVRRDPLQVSIKQTGAALMVSLLVGDVFGGTALGGMASSLVENGYSRDAEAAADFLAVTAMNQLGLTARPLAEFVAAMQREDPLADVVPNFLSTHPSGTDRHREILELSQGMGRSMSGYDWDIVRRMCRQGAEQG